MAINGLTIPFLMSHLQPNKKEGMLLPVIELAPCTRRTQIRLRSTCMLHDLKSEAPVGCLVLRQYLHEIWSNCRCIKTLSLDEIMLSGRRIVNRYRYMSVSPSRPQSVQRSVSIGDVHIPLDIPERPDLVPRGYFDALSCPEVLEHIRWIAQKRIMKQDIFLLGLPSSLRRRVVMAAAELCDWEVRFDCFCD